MLRQHEASPSLAPQIGERRPFLNHMGDNSPNERGCEQRKPSLVSDQETPRKLRLINRPKNVSGESVLPLAKPSLARMAENWQPRTVLDTHRFKILQTWSLAEICDPERLDLVAPLKMPKN